MGIFLAISFPFRPLPSSLKFKKSAPPPCHSSKYSDDVMVRTKTVSVHHQNELNDDATIVPPIDVMVRTKPKIEQHEDNNNQTSHKRKLTQCQRQHINDSKKIMSQLGHSNTAYTVHKSVMLHMQHHPDIAHASLSLPGVTVAETAASLLSPATTPPSQNNIRTSTPFCLGLCFFLFVIDLSTTHSNVSHLAQFYNF
ncbi:hypothetical protein O181_097305 [Austropuccinia psidii MF-1]|uniref:Uncharacterized protein n=1 Tax=Austropuccinia psidii MF-1 TaxID=1389203 RepID=A0A9Q3J9C0_9BASI|nr:hypothetical protein [Austropuccinia psidii MF-1]